MGRFGDSTYKKKMEMGRKRKRSEELRKNGGGNYFLLVVWCCGAGLDRDTAKWIES